KNHFAYLMEMGLGLALGLVAGGGVSRDRALVYVATLLPIWTALVLCNSRGGLLSMLVQVVFMLLLLTAVVPARVTERRASRAWILVRSKVARLVLGTVLVLVVVFGIVWVGGDRLVTSIEAARGEFSEEAAHTRQGVTRHEIWQATW